MRHVWTLTAFGRLPCMSSSMKSSPVRMSAPACCSLTSTASSRPGSVCVTRTWPRVIAAATRKVPVSMRSGRIAVLARRCRLSTPSTTIVAVPAPRILAPIARQAARQIDDFRFARGVLEHGRALGQRPRPSSGSRCR